MRSGKDMTVVRSIELGVGAALLFILAACGSTVETEGSGGGQGSSTSGSSSGTGSGVQCGGFVGARCPADEFCDYPDDQCGVADGAGACVRLPEVCSRELAPACGCDGKTYENPCIANAAGADILKMGACTGG
jgi:hypothetical protein